MTGLRIGVAGYGRMGRRHARIVADHPTATLAAILEPDDSMRQEAAAAHPGAALHDDAAAFFADALDGVLVVTPEDTHAALTRQAFGAGTAALVEKPLALELEEAKALAAAAADRRLVYQAGYLLRYENRHGLLRDHVAAGAIGDPVRLHAKRDCSRSWFEAYGHRVHPAHETLVHDIDLVVWLTGQRVSRVSAWERRDDTTTTPHTIVAVLELDGGALAVCETSWLVPPTAPANIVAWGEGDGVIDASLEVVGTAGSARLDSYPPPLRVYGAAAALVPDDGYWPDVSGRPSGALREEIWDFLARLAGEPGRGVADVEEAVHVQAVANASVTAAREAVPIDVAR